MASKSPLKYLNARLTLPESAEPTRLAVGVRSINNKAALPLSPDHFCHIKWIISDATTLAGSLCRAAITLSAKQVPP